MPLGPSHPLASLATTPPPNSGKPEFGWGEVGAVGAG